MINMSDVEFSIGFESKTRFNKERAVIGKSEAEYVTENIIIPGVPSSAVTALEPTWTKALEESIDQMVSVPYAKWKALDTNLPSTRKGGKSVHTLLSEITTLFSDAYGIDFEYNKATKSITVPQYALDLINIIRDIQNTKGLVDSIIQAASLKDYDTDIYSLVELLDALIDEQGMSFTDFLESVGGEFYYSDTRQVELFDEFGNPTENAFTEEGLSQPQQEPVREELKIFQDQTDKMVQQLTNLYDSKLMNDTAIRHAGEQAVFFISDSITEFL